MKIIRNATIRTYARQLQPGEVLDVETLPIPLPGSVLIVIVNQPGYAPDGRIETIIVLGDGLEMEDTHE